MGAFSPTGCVFCESGPVLYLTSPTLAGSSPLHQIVYMPARQARSHSASVHTQNGQGRFAG